MSNDMTKKIELTKGLFAIVDDTDYERVNKYKWFANCGRNWSYAARRGKSRNIVYMHRFIMDAPNDMQVDHINGDGLDNRKANLRLCTESENKCNRVSRKGTSKYKGVSWITQDRKWRAAIRIDGKSHHIGLFADEEEAAHAYDEAAHKYHGRFAKTNF